MPQSEKPAMKKIVLYLLFCSLYHETVAQLLPSKTPAKKPAAPATTPKTTKAKPKTAEVVEKKEEVVKSDKQGIILITSDVPAELYVDGQMKGQIIKEEPYTLKLSKGTHSIVVESQNFQIGDTIENFKVETGEELKPWYVNLKEKEVEIWTNRFTKLISEVLIKFARAENYSDKDDIENRFSVEKKNEDFNYTNTYLRNPNLKLLSLKSSTNRITVYGIKFENITDCQIQQIKGNLSRYYGTTALLKLVGTVNEKNVTSSGYVYSERKADGMSIPINSNNADGLLKELQVLLQKKPSAFVK